MRLVLCIAALALALILPMFPAGAQGPTSGSEADSAAIKKLCADFSEKFQPP